ncbi:hypothetical protein O181_005320 [Austropuccinia psidii MF-1]|uniref:Uncharacterized protein n=1 Tax=Austropuccinia psidii MF-1 TaxID=1389203 RepID=A0A9Q3BI56_9BASI|nr:hypothetical protein [Austropuccinia psidii MF-1]
MEYIHGTATKMNFCIENAQHPLIIDSGAHFSMVAREYNCFQNWKKLLPTKAQKFKSESGNMTSIGTIIKEIIIPYRKVNIRLNPECVRLEDSHIQGFLLQTDYQRIYGIESYNSKNRHINIGTNKEKKSPLYIYHMSNQDRIEEFLNEFKEGKFSANLTSQQKLSLLKIQRRNRPSFAIG